MEKDTLTPMLKEIIFLRLISTLNDLWASCDGFPKEDKIELLERVIKWYECES